MGKYTVLKSGDLDVGGIAAPPPGAKVPPSWLAYCSALDVDAAAAKATKLGGKVMAQPMDIPNVGRFAVVIDPQGAAIAPFKQAEERAELEGAPPVGSFCWDELITSDPAAALTFYREVFGFTADARDMGPMGTYHVLKRGERQAAGIMKSPMPGQPPAWLGYVAVNDVDERAKKAAQLKGKLIVPPSDIPGIGRFAVVADVQGAAIALFKGAM
jgi:predicted enzyme related to lactoylglutathione lyase